jgi:hypothetical protein
MTWATTPPRPGCAPASPSTRSPSGSVANPNTTLKIYAHVLGEAQDFSAIAHLDAIDTQRQPNANYDPPTGQTDSIHGPSI